MSDKEVMNTEDAINKIIKMLENQDEIYICDLEGNRLLIDDSVKEILLSNYRLDLIQKKVDIKNDN